jgi:hypothetical protein
MTQPFSFLRAEWFDVHESASQVASLAYADPRDGDGDDLSGPPAGITKKLSFDRARHEALVARVRHRHKARAAFALAPAEQNMRANARATTLGRRVARGAPVFLRPRASRLTPQQQRARAPRKPGVWGPLPRPRPSRPPRPCSRLPRPCSPTFSAPPSSGLMWTSKGAIGLTQARE